MPCKGSIEWDSCSSSRWLTGAAAVGLVLVSYLVPIWSSFPIASVEAQNRPIPRPMPPTVPAPPTPTGPLPPAPPPPPLPSPGNGTTPILGGFAIFPKSIFNRDISQLPVASYSATVMPTFGGSRLHADFGTMWEGLQNGIPFNVGGNIPANVSFEEPDESDPGPYRFNSVPNIEATAKAGDPPNLSDGRDHHCLTVGTDGKLYELYQGIKQSNGSWRAYSGAVWNLSSNKMRPATWTSSDAAGLPITPFLVKYSEIQAGVINHALRFTLQRTKNQYVWPASHQAGVNTTTWPPMGARLRLRAGFDISSYPSEVRIILTALKKYGMILADNGSNGYFQGEPNPNWNSDNLNRIHGVLLNNFDIVDESSLQVAPNSYESY